MMPDISYCWIDAADYGVYKLETKTKSDSGIDFTVNCSSNHDTKKFIGSLETKYKWSDYGEQKYRLVSLACSVTCTDHCRHWRRQAPCRKIAISTVSRQFWWTCAYRRALLRSWSKSVLDHPGSPSAAWYTHYNWSQCYGLWSIISSDLEACPKSCRCLSWMRRNE